MTEDEIIDELLKRAEELPSFPFFELYEEVTEIDLESSKPDFNQAKNILKLMKYNNLFKDHSNAYYSLTGKGVELNRSGGWLKHLESEKSELSVEQKTKQLTLEKLEYEQTIRDQEQRIRDLTEELKAVSLFKKYWWVIVTSLSLGVALQRIVAMYY